MFMFFAPLQNWRPVKITDHQTKADWAECMRELVDVHFPDAEIITGGRTRPRGVPAPTEPSARRQRR